MLVWTDAREEAMTRQLGLGRRIRVWWDGITGRRVFRVCYLSDGKRTRLVSKDLADNLAAVFGGKVEYHG